MFFLFVVATRSFSAVLTCYSGDPWLWYHFRCVVALWEAFHVEIKHFDLDTLRVPNRSPTPISKSNDFLGQSDDI